MKKKQSKETKGVHMTTKINYVVMQTLAELPWNMGQRCPAENLLESVYSTCKKL